MQRVDPGYLYELGEAVRALKPFRFKNVPPYEIFTPLTRAQQAIERFFTQSVYSQTVRGVHVQGSALQAQIQTLLDRIFSDGVENFTAVDLQDLAEAYDRFEPAFHSALSMQVLYLVTPRGAYDLILLVENGKSVFPESVAYKCPEAIGDIEQGAKALAFELWTAAAFHFHRANEAVLRRYFDLSMGLGKRGERDTMGTMLKKLDDADKGKKTVRVALHNIKEFHRNPTAHPGHFLSSADEALDLVSAIRAAMGYMLEELEALPLDELMASVPQTIPPPAPPPSPLAAG